MYWWTLLGYPAFEPRADGLLPRPGQVVKYFREKKMNSKGKAWTQRELARALGITEAMVRNIENRDIGLDYERREFLSKLLNIPPVLLGVAMENEIDKFLKAGRMDEALIDFEKAWYFEKKLPNNLRGSILLESARPKAESATTEQERIKIVRSIDVVGTLIRAGSQEEDPHLLKLDLDCYHLYKSYALIAIGWNKQALEELALIKGFSGYLLRQVYYDILQAQAYTNLGNYEQATYLLGSALKTAKDVNSKVNIDRIAKIYRQLKNSPYKDAPGVAQIDYLLHKKPRVKKP
jgi:transcriptional regulator with XRE-family HTH domain